MTIRFASTCGRWLIRATSRSWAAGSIATRERAELGDEPVDQAVAGGVGVGGRGQEPGRALEQAGRGVLGALRLGAGDRVPADEARRSPAAAATTLALVEPTSVTVARSPVRASTAATWAGSADDRGGDDRRARPPPAPTRASAAAVDRAAARGQRERARIGIPAATAAPRAARGQADRGADQPGADDRDPGRAHAAGSGCRARISSARRKARSSAWRPLSRGSQSVS